MHESAKTEMRRLVDKYGRHPRTVLDVGSYDVNGNYREFFDRTKTEYIGIDLRPGLNVDIVVDDFSPLPLPADGIGWQMVVSGSTLEHCRNPFRLVKRIRDAMAPGALFICTTPFCWHYHEHPIDCFRFAPEGMRSICDEAGLETVEAYMVEIRSLRVDTYLVARRPIA